MEIKVKRVYEAFSDKDGLRVLVDKFWPRGVKKSALQYDIWAKEVAPSSELRRTFHLNPDQNWPAFVKDYTEELEHSDAFKSMIEEIREINPSCITLLFAFKNCDKNHALILKSAMEKALS